MPASHVDMQQVDNARACMQFRISELRGLVDRDEQLERTFHAVRLAAIDREVADFVGLDPWLCLGLLLPPWETRDAVAYQAAMQIGARQVGNHWLQAIEYIV